MKLAAFLIAGAVVAAPLAGQAADVQYIPVTRPSGGAPGLGGASPPFSAAVRAGDTVYLAGTTDGGTAAVKPGEAADAAARRALDNLKRAAEAAGVSMDDLVWVQIFCSDLSLYATFNDAYRTYFKGPNLPARAFLGADHLLGGAKFEVMGVAVRRTK